MGRTQVSTGASAVVNGPEKYLEGSGNGGVPLMQRGAHPLAPGEQRERPICDHVFRGHEWDGIDAHWRAKHPDSVCMRSFGPGCARFTETSFCRVQVSTDNRELTTDNCFIGAEEGTRTPTPLRVHGPEPCASANSATSARKAASKTLAAREAFSVYRSSLCVATPVAAEDFTTGAAEDTEFEDTGVWNATVQHLLQHA